MLLQDPNIEKIFNIVNKKTESIRLVGGCVRDSVLKKEIYDIDLATKYTPEQIVEIFNSYNIKVLPTGINHGTVSVLMDKKRYEITTLRRDLICDGRHAKVEFTDDWREDAIRRDFTFNAMYIDSKGNLYDYFNGLNDLKEKRLRFVGDPSKRIAEDYLRILRAFRFYVRFCEQPLELNLINAIKEAAHNISKLSVERIKSEIFRLLEEPNSSIGIKLMTECGVFEHVFLKNLYSLDLLIFAENSPFELDCLLKLILIIIENNINFVNLCKLWKMSNKEKKIVYFIMENYPLFNLDQLEKNMNFFIRSFGIQNYISLIKIITIIEVCKKNTNVDLINKMMFCIEQAKNRHIPPLPLNGNDLLNFGLSGSMVGSYLEFCWKLWEDSNYTINKNDLLDKVFKDLNKN